MEAGIDVVRTGLCAAHLDAALSQSAQHADRNAGLAGARTRRTDDQAARRHASSPFGSTRPRSSARMETILPMAIKAGEVNPRRSASAATLPSVVTWTRSRGVVAAMMIAAGVSD